MMKSFILMLMFILPGLSVFSQTNEHPIDKFVKECTEADPSTFGMIGCYREAETKWDEELNKNYKLVMASADDNSKLKIKSAQLAWIKFRDAEFELLLSFYGQMQGSMYQIFAAEKRLDIIRSRALVLKNYYDDFQMSKE